MYINDALGSVKHQLLIALPTNQYKMKSIILVALALVATAAAAPAEKPSVEIVSYNFDQSPDGAYNVGYETSDGSSRQESGVVKEALNEENKLQKVVIVSGSYSYLNSEGKQDTIKYFADETGYHAEGDSIPKVVSRR